MELTLMKWNFMANILQENKFPEKVRHANCMLIVIKVIYIFLIRKH